MLEVEKATLDVAGASRLEQIRASMGGGAGTGAPAVEGSQAVGALGAGTPSVDQLGQTTAQPAAEPVERPEA